MFDQNDLLGPQQLLRDDDAPQGVFGGRAGVTYNVRVTKVDTQCRSWIDTCVHACHYRQV